MKFIASKKLSDNATLRAVIIWMLIALILAMGLNLAAKSIDYGTTLTQWENTILGNEVEFIDPLSFNDLLLTVHTELFGLLLVFILIASLSARTSRPVIVKMGFLSMTLLTLLLYPVALLTTPWFGSIGVVIAASAFLLFHVLMIASGADLLIALMRNRL
jgi:hypothetical protein